MGAQAHGGRAVPTDFTFGNPELVSEAGVPVGALGRNVSLVLAYKVNAHFESLPAFS